METEIQNNIYDFILSLFTDNENDLRPILNFPFKNGNMVYATDAHSMIRMSETIPKSDYSKHPLKENMKPPSGEKIYSDFKKLESATFNTSKFLLKFYNSKLNLDYKLESCEICDGHGYTDCECCGSELDCKTCDGDGHTDKHLLPIVAVYGKDLKFFDKVFSPTLLYKVAHTLLLLRCETFKAYKSDKTSMLFVFDEVEIIIMGKFISENN